MAGMVRRSERSREESAEAGSEAQGVVHEVEHVGQAKQAHFVCSGTALPMQSPYLENPSLMPICITMQLCQAFLRDSTRKYVFSI
jgi:hypothetical protein